MAENIRWTTWNRGADKVAVRGTAQLSCNHKVEREKQCADDKRTIETAKTVVMGDLRTAIADHFLKCKKAK